MFYVIWFKYNGNLQFEYPYTDYSNYIHSDRIKYFHAIDYQENLIISIISFAQIFVMYIFGTN